jgi:hypothetical protein
MSFTHVLLFDMAQPHELGAASVIPEASESSQTVLGRAGDFERALRTV